MLRGLAFFGRRAELMGTMLRRLDIDVERACAQALGTTMQRLVRVCSFCPRPETCAQWLAGSGDPAGYRRFCPNADKLDVLPRRGAPGAGRH